MTVIAVMAPPNYLVGAAKHNKKLSDENCAMHCAICNGAADPLKHAPPRVCYRGEFGSSIWKGVSINRRGTPKLGSAGVPPLVMGSVAATQGTRPCPRVTLPNVFVLR